YNQEATGSGSGLIVAQNSKSLYIATNNHVVEDATKVTVKFNDESTYEAAVKGTDSDSDLAVVSIPMKELSGDTLKNIKVATLGDSDQVKVGNQAIAIGNALGYGTSVTVGYISAKDREINAEDSTMKVLQTDAAINPGNSGGALVDANGAVIGINSAKLADTQVEGMGFAIPVSTAIPIINEIMEAENISEEEQGYLGIKGTDVEEEYAEYYNIPKGIYVKEVMEDSPAAKAGLKTGDIIVEFDGREVTTMTGLQERLEKTKAGSTIKLVVKRSDDGEYKERALNVTLGSKADAGSAENEAQDFGENENGRSEERNGGNRMPNGNSGQNGEADDNGQNGRSFWGGFGNFYGN
ncbi:MAG: trypsin-like peptidase domain-containing protein, partial [Lachnospiraceae bacterium]|nr:trypsin-like peptidase domain-containing protein [Lachnospiraceae bacterium]